MGKIASKESKSIQSNVSQVDLQATEKNSTKTVLIVTAEINSECHDAVGHNEVNIDEEILKKEAARMSSQAVNNHRTDDENWKREIYEEMKTTQTDHKEICDVEIDGIEFIPDELFEKEWKISEISKVRNQCIDDIVDSKIHTNLTKKIVYDNDDENDEIKVNGMIEVYEDMAGENNENEITVDDILHHVLCVKEQIDYEMSELPEEIEELKNSREKIENVSSREIDLKSVDDLLNYILETADQLGKATTVDVAVETEYKDKKRNKRPAKIRWKVQSVENLKSIVENREVTSERLAGGDAMIVVLETKYNDKKSPVIDHAPIHTNTTNTTRNPENAETQTNRKPLGINQVEIVEKMPPVEKLRNETVDFGKVDHDKEVQVRDATWNFIEKILVEFNGHYAPISYEKIEIILPLETQSHYKGDEEKPVGPLALFSFLQVGVELNAIRSTTSAGRHLATGTILATKEFGVNFPLVHIKEDDGTFVGYLNNGHKLDNTVIQQGLYREVRSICPEEELKQIKPEEKDNVAYILLGFKSLDTNFSQVMVDSWKDWTGARYIYMYLPDDLGLARIRFYHRELPNGTSTIFTYLVVVECRNVDSNEKQMKLLEFARRLRVQKINSYISVYGISLNA